MNLASQLSAGTRSTSLNPTVPEEPGCDYCGLPVARSRHTLSSHRDEPVFCCFGCRFAMAVANEQGATGQMRWTMTRLGLAVFFTMNVMVFTLVLWTQDVFQPDPGDTGQLASLLHDLFRYICLIMATPVLLLLGGPLVASSWSGLRRLQLSTDLLLLVGVLASFVYSAVSVVRGSGHVYFEVSCMVLVAVTLGRWLEATGKLKTTEALESLGKLLPEQVQRVRQGEVEMVPLERVTQGDVLRVAAGQRIATDGQVIKNRAMIDDQILTGESQPRLREPGDLVLGGALNIDGDLWIEVTTAPNEGSLPRLMRAVREAAQRKGAYQRLADRIAGWFLPCVGVVAVSAFSVHWYLDGLHVGLMSGLAVVLIACPCALGLATPMAIWAAFGRAAREQVLFRDGDAVTNLAQVDVVALDKTGTLTESTPTLAKTVVEDPEERASFDRRAAALAATNRHPLSSSIQASSGMSQTLVDVANLQVLPGLGLIGKVADEGVTWMGSARWMRSLGWDMGSAVDAALALADREGNSVVCLAWEDRVRGAMIFAEQMRPGATAVLEWLVATGHRVMVLTGDSLARAERLRRELGVDVRAELLPEEKLAVVEQLRKSGAVVAMVGDGVNDAPALVAANCGVAMGCGADLARESAPVGLLGNDLTRLPWAIALSRETVRVIRQNLFWAFAYNGVGVAVAASGWLNPILAAVAMVGSSLFVVSNSLKLGRYEPDRRTVAAGPLEGNSAG